MNALIQSAVVTMSSREIAELVELRHDNVKRTIDSLVERGVIASPQVEEKATAGRPAVEYRIGKRDSYVIVAQLSPAFTARLVDRWQELESQASQPAIDLNNANSLRTLLLGYTEKVLALEAKVEADAPKVAFVDKYTQADGNKGFREVAKLLNANEREFCAFLIGADIMYRLNGRLTAHAHHQHVGRFAVKAGIGNNDHAFTQSMFTPKGIAWVAEKWVEYQSATV